MNKLIIKEELKWLIEAINEQFATISTYDERIPQIEYDILMDNIRKFYDDLRRLHQPDEIRHITENAPPRLDKAAGDATVLHAAAPSDLTGRNPGRAPSEPGKTITAPESVAPVRAESFQNIPEPLTSGPLHESIPAPEADAPPAIKVRFDHPQPSQKETAPPPKRTPKAQPMDLFASEEPTFSIKLQEAREKSLGPKVPSDRIDNLKSAITINDKFMFINDLFDGNLREYNETIETLNGFKTLDQAGDFLDLMRKKNFWDTGSRAFLRLKELLERKF